MTVETIKKIYEVNKDSSRIIRMMMMMITTTAVGFF